MYKSVLLCNRHGLRKMHRLHVCMYMSLVHIYTISGNHIIGGVIYRQLFVANIHVRLVFHNIPNIAYTNTTYILIGVRLHVHCDCCAGLKHCHYHMYICIHVVMYRYMLYPLCSDPLVDHLFSSWLPLKYAIE